MLVLISWQRLEGEVTLLRSGFERGGVWSVVNKDSRSYLDGGAAGSPPGYQAFRGPLSPRAREDLGTTALCNFLFFLPAPVFPVVIYSECESCVPRTLTILEATAYVF